MSIQEFQAMHEDRVRIASEMKRCRELAESAKTEYTSLRTNFKDRVLSLPEETRAEYDGYCSMFGQDLGQWSEIGDALQ